MTAGAASRKPQSAEATPFLAVTRTRFADHAYTHLLHRIVTGEFAEGTALPSENSLCRLFGISRPVVREALDRLRSEGLVESRQGSGTFVRVRAPGAEGPIAEKQQSYLRKLEFRAAIEPQAAALAARRRSPAQLDAIASAIERYERVAVLEGSVGEHLDFAFHLAVAEAANNDHFVDAIRTIAYDIDHGVNILRYLAQFQHLERGRSVLADHSRVFEAIRQGHAAEAEAAMRDHIAHARMRVVQQRPEIDEIRA